MTRFQVAGNIHLYSPYGRLLEIQGERGSQKPKFLKESMKLNWNFQRGEKVRNKTPYTGEAWKFSGTTQSLIG